MGGNLDVYLQVSNRKQVRADIKVFKTKFTKVTPTAQTKGSVSCQRFMMAIQVHLEERKERRKERRMEEKKSKRGKEERI